MLMSIPFPIGKGISKFEYRNSKQIQNYNFLMFKTVKGILAGSGVLLMVADQTIFVQL